MPFDWSLYGRPAIDDEQAVMDKMSDSVPGPDLVRYSAWCVGGAATVGAVYALAKVLFRGEVHRGLHTALCVFIPKRDGAPDGSHSADCTSPPS